MRRSRRVVFGAPLLALLLVAAACGTGGDDDETAGNGEERPQITVGDDSFAESQIVAEMFTIVLEEAGFEVDRTSVDSREIRIPAMESGEIDLAPEYLATLLLFLNPDADPPSDPADAADQLEPLVEERGLALLEFSEAVDTNAFVVTQETADEFDLEAVSDLQGVAGDMTLGGPPECPQRPFCIPGLKRVYDVEFGRFRQLDVGGPITVQALAGGEIDVGLLFSTSGAIARQGFVLLEDDRNLQAADNIVPLIRSDVLDQEITDLLNQITAALTTENITELNARVEVDQEDPDAVARSFLEEEGLL
ncbi:MAG: ABC transporter substrate-binding protein [Actinomycetota bacterium]